MLGIGGTMTYLVGCIIRSPLHDKAIIAELERVRTITEVWIQNQDPDTGMLHPKKGSEGDYVCHLASDLDSLLEKCRDDWLSTSLPEDTPSGVMNWQEDGIRSQTNQRVSLLVRNNQSSMV